MPDSCVRTTLAFHTTASSPRILEDVMAAIESMRRAGRPLPQLLTGATLPGRGGPIVSISLTWRAPDPSAVLGDVLAALGESGIPYEVVETRCDAVLLIDEAEE